MSNKQRTWLLIVLAAVVFFAGLHWLFGPEPLPRGARLNLPTGPVAPMISMTPNRGLILAGDGSLWSWGIRPGTALGLGEITQTPYLRRVGNDRNWVNVSSEQVYSLAVKSDGTMWAWGRNVYGQFGNGTRTVTGPSNQVSTTPVPGAPGNDWKAVAAGASFSIGLKKDGTIWAWGYNIRGTGTSNLYTLSPMQVGADTNWTRVIGNGFSPAVLKSDGSLWMCISDPSNGGVLSTRMIPSDTNWVDGTSGSGMFLAVKSDGTLWGQGGPNYLYGCEKNASGAAFERIGTNNDWKSVHGGAEALCFSLAKKDGTVWTLQVYRQPIPGGPMVPPGTLQFNRMDVPGATSLGMAWDRTGVALGQNGEVWTWGEMLGTNVPARPALQTVAKWANKLRLNVHWGDAHPIVHEKPRLLPNIDPDAPK